MGTYIHTLIFLTFSCWLFYLFIYLFGKFHKSSHPTHLTAICSISQAHYYGATTLTAALMTQLTSLAACKTDLVSFISSSEMASIKYGLESGNGISVRAMGVMVMTNCFIWTPVYIWNSSIFRTDC